MSYLNFDRTLLVNLEKSLKKETLHTNRLGAYSATTIVDCNTRKYHGLLVTPAPEVGAGRYVLLSSLDETVIQHGAEFNLGLHKYNGSFSPNGHKYIRQYNRDVISRTIYRVGGVLLQKERILMRDEARVLVRYKLIEALSSIKMRFRPFLAFRSVNELCYENNMLNKDYQMVDNGVSMSLYPRYPRLNMQFSRKVDYVHVPDWYRGIEYPKEQERGYAYSEDLFVPGYFELTLRPEEEVIFTAGLTDVSPHSLRNMWAKESERQIEKNDMFGCLKNSAMQFYKEANDKQYILAGFPWFSCIARNQFLALPGLTLSVGEVGFFEKAMKTAVEEMKPFLAGDEAWSKKTSIQELNTPDALLWFVWSVQQYAASEGEEKAFELYGEMVLSIISFIRAQKHPRLLVHSNGLLFTEGRTEPATWMNAVEDGMPITPRTGYVVEINALWYNALKYAVQLADKKGDLHLSEVLDCQAELAKQSFVETFWNGVYLSDYVIDNYADKEVRPNMIFAVSLPYSPLDRKQQKSVVDICSKELLTPKGLRSLSPKSGCYRPFYRGGQLERDRNYHNGPVWPWLIGAYSEAYLKIYKHSGVSFVERMMSGFDGSMRELCIGTIGELNDGNPPFKGHGAMSFATNVAAILRVFTILKKYNNR